VLHGEESESERLRRLIAQCDAMIAELLARGTSRDAEMARRVEEVRSGLQERLVGLLGQGDP
jgi:hypothetical protein